MRLLLDENLSYRIVAQLLEACSDAVHVGAVGLTDTDDDVILARAAREDRMVVIAAPTSARCSLWSARRLPRWCTCAPRIASRRWSRAS